MNASARLCVRPCKGLRPRRDPTREDAAGAILCALRKRRNAALDAIQLLGGNGVYQRLYPTGRWLRDAKLNEIGGRHQRNPPQC